MELLSATEARRLALARAGLLAADGTGFPARAPSDPEGARAAALAVLRRFGYLQLDTISIAGARSHALVLLSRLEGLDPALPETLLAPGEPLFEYWGHEASWIPMELHPHFAFRRRAFRRHPWWGDVLRRHRGMVRAVLRRAREEGPFRASDLEGKGEEGWWGHKPEKRVAEALWSAGLLAIRERRGFLRTYDLPERVIPGEVLRRRVAEPAAVRDLVRIALEGHGWAEARTLAATFRLRTTRPSFRAALRRLERDGEILPCAAEVVGGGRRQGFVRPADLALARELGREEPGGGGGVLLSPFDPVLWDRARVRQLFGFEQVLEIYKPAAVRKYGYFCLPVLSGDRLVARVDLKAERDRGRLRVLSCRLEEGGTRARAAARQAARAALRRHGESLGLRVEGRV